MSTVTIQLPGYQISEEVYSGSRVVVYRAVRQADQLPVVIKLLKCNHPSFSELVQFRNQYVIAKNLQIPGVIQPYALDPYLNGYALVMEDFGGTSLCHVVNGKPLAIKQFLLIALQLSDTLHHLHQQRVIHKDIKPANILIHPNTQQVKLIDFSIATLLPRETQQIQSLNTLEGTLAYLSPEQTGRMNRGIDYHSDLYSLGVSFFELLTGQLPFQSNDPMELIHCHLAKQPPQVHTLNPAIPPVLSAVVTKLMAKNAEDRYQSALGLKYDLYHCLEQVTATAQIELFKLGQRDVSDRFLIPEKLYGREREVRTLLAAFERVAGIGNGEGGMGNGRKTSLAPYSPLSTPLRSELILVAGFSGIGKTAVINEVHKPIVRRRGYFVKGKFDQFQRNIPFSAFVQALQGLIGQLLSESDSQLERWKTKILDALGGNGQVITEVIPELEQVIGQQPPVPELSGNAAQNRFNLLFQKFIQVFTNPEHPLVIFLDDLQWADLASLKLMQLLAGKSGCAHLLFIGAYRDNEVSPAHPLMLVLEEIEQAGAAVDTIRLAPLQPVHLNQLIADTFNCSTERSQPLTELVYQKTEGNPFFINQFLRALHDDGLIQFNLKGGYWQCDIAQVRALSLPEDVAVFMAQRLQKLPSATQQVLKLAACIGNPFDLATLAIACEVGPAVVAANLWRALREGLILPTNEIYKFYQDAPSSQLANRSAHYLEHSSLNPNACTYRFLHDRVQQAAYSLIPVDQKQATHFAIGQLLLKKTPAAQREEQIFEIVNQLNRGLNLVSKVSERENLAQLNLVASRRAKHATAYGAALDYANVGVALLPDDRWQRCYPLSLALHELAVELAFLNGHFEQVEQQAQIVRQQSKTLFDQVKVYEIQILARTAENRPMEAVEIALNLLRALGVSLPDRPTAHDIHQVLSDTAALYLDKDISALVNLPEMTDSYALSALQVLNAIFPSCYAVAPNLIPLVAALGAQLSMTHGNGPLSAIAYANYGMLLCGIVNDLESGYAFGQLALNLMPQFPEAATETRVTCMVATFILHWKRHLREIIPVLQAGHQSGMQTGDLQFQAWGYYDECQAAYLIGQELTVLEQKLVVYGQALRQIRQEIPLDRSELLRQVVLNLLGRSPNPCQLIGEAYDEQQSRDRYETCNDTEGLYVLNFHKFILCYWLGDSKQALAFANLAKPHLNNVPAQSVVPVFYFYDSLVRLALCSTASEPDYADFLDCVDSNQQKIEFWSTYAPMNVQHKYELVAAEKCRVLGQRAEAIDHYDRAIALAKEHGFVQEEALANELSAKFYLDWGKVRIAQEYMTEAYYGYARWGAKAKIADLETRYANLLTPILQQTDALTPDSALSVLSSQLLQHSTLPVGSGVSHALDLASVLKASQILSSEIQLDKLLSILLKLVIENAGAEKGVFILHEHNQLHVEAVMQIGGKATVLQSIPLQDSPDVPANLIHTIKRMRRPLVIENATDYPSLAQDAYIQRQQPKSLLCLPILHQGKLLGVLYLENNLTAGAFTSDRVEISNLLCAQAAISLANARLYRQSQTTLQTLQQSQQLLQLVMDTLPQRVFWKDRNFRYLGCNRHFAQDAGMQSPKQLIGKDDFELVWRELAHLYQEDDQVVMEQGTSRINYEEPQVREDGFMVWLRTSKIPLRNKAGDIIGIFGCYEDITPLKEAEEGLRRSEAELRQKSEELTQALQDLQQAQLQLVQNEKMSALGSLVAGVAHEINNPVGFIAGNLQPAKDYINDLLGLIELYQTKFPHPGEDVEAEIAAIDLAYVHEDLPKLLDSMKSGVDRIRNISTSLRIFSRADSDRPQPFDLHEGIDSTLLILKHRLRANETRPEIAVIKHYGELPLVECFAGQLNQVFMNLLANAIDALEESNQERRFADIEATPNQITIRTEVIHSQPLPTPHSRSADAPGGSPLPTPHSRSADAPGGSPLPTPHIIIYIRDNGTGIPEEIKHQIFDHLFTTKAIGKGTGLGLAIARQIIVEKHRGTIHVDSAPGQGTEFVIRIPVKAELRVGNRE